MRLQKLFNHLNPQALSLAEKFYLALRRLEPNQIFILDGLAKIARRRADQTSELTFLEDILKIDPLAQRAQLRRAEILHEIGRDSEAEKLFLNVCRQQPGNTDALRGLALIARKNSDKKSELAFLERIQKAKTLAPKARLRRGVLLCELGRCGEAEKVLGALLAENLEEPDVLKALAKTAAMARDYHLARDRWEDLCQKFPDNSYIQVSHIKSLIKTTEVKKAQTLLDQRADSIDPAAFSMVQSDIHEALLNWDTALKVIQEACLEWPDKPSLRIREIRIQMIMFRRFGDPQILDDALPLLEKLKQKFPKNLEVQILVSELFILRGDFRAAADEIDRLPDTCHQKVMELKAWQRHIQGDEKGAKHIWEDIQNIHYIPQVNRPSPEALRREDVHSLVVGEKEILLFTVIRNEKWRLPWFLEYYRSLGVDRFFFVDNDSSDGTKEYLLEQKNNVHVYWTSDNYGNACSGMQWVNELVSLHGQGNWCLYVDVDEALIFPGIEQSNLRRLTAYMDSKGHEALFAFMNDMFADESNPSSTKLKSEDFLTKYPLFDNRYHFSNVIYCPYQFVSGGLRKRFGIGEMLTKTPLIRSGRGIKFLLSSHRITPAVISDVTGTLLHYKLAGNYREKFLEDVENNTRIPDCQRRHIAYSNGLQQMGNKQDLTNETTLRYSSSGQLLDLGLIESSPDFHA